MNKRLDGIPSYRSYTTTIEGHYYNHVQLALKRLDKEIRIPIPGLKYLHLILNDDAWIVVDSVHADVPVAAWTDFEIDHRESLTAPIKCKISQYHAAAGMILKRTLDAMELIIDKELAEQHADENHTVVKFKTKE